VIRLRPTHLRARLTLWFVSALAGLLILAWGATFAILFWQLRSQLDHFAIQEIETVEGLMFFTPQGELQMHEDYHNHPESKDVIDRFLEILSPDGAVLYRNERLGNRVLGGAPFAGEGVGGYSVRSERLADGTRVRPNPGKSPRCDALRAVRRLPGGAFLSRLFGEFFRRPPLCVEGWFAAYRRAPAAEKLSQLVPSGVSIYLCNLPAG